MTNYDFFNGVLYRKFRMQNDETSKYNFLKTFSQSPVSMHKKSRNMNSGILII